MNTKAGTDLTPQFMEALRTPDLILQLDRNLFGGQALIRLMKPGPTSRSKPVQLVPVVVAEEGMTHAQLLVRVAEAMEQARAEVKS